MNLKYVTQGRGVRVAPDATVDEKTGATFYIGAVEVAPEELANIPNARLYPGMPVEASIVTGERRVLDYIIQPITDGFARAFRED